LLGALANALLVAIPSHFGLLGMTPPSTTRRLFSESAIARDEVPHATGSRAVQMPQGSRNPLPIACRAASLALGLGGPIHLKAAARPVPDSDSEESVPVRRFASAGNGMPHAAARHGIPGTRRSTIDGLGDQ
jgi:hypothetical protein